MATSILQQFNFKGVSYGVGDESALDSATTAAERSNLDAMGYIDDGVTPGAIGGIPSVDVAGIVVGDVAIGAVELKDGTTDARSVVKAGTSIVAGDVALAVKDPVTGAVDGAAVITDANGTLQQYLRGLVKLVAAKINVKVADGDHVVLGATDGAAVVTDANGTVQQYLRGLVKLIVAKITVLIGAGEAHMGEVGGNSSRVQGTMTRTNDTNSYAANDLVADTVTAGSVTPITLAVGRINAGTGILRRCTLKVDDVSPWAGKTIRVHFYATSPTCTNGDNGAWLTTESTYIGAMDVAFDRTFSDYVKGVGVPIVGSEIAFVCAGGSTSIYALLQTLSAVTTPAASKTFTLAVDAHRN